MIQLWGYFVVLAFIGAFNARALSVVVVSAIGLMTCAYDANACALIVAFALPATVAAQFARG